LFILNLTVYFLPLGELLPLDFEIQGGRDERLIDGVTGILIKEIKEGSLLHKNDVKVGDHILKVKKIYTRLRSIA